MLEDSLNKKKNNQPPTFSQSCSRCADFQHRAHPLEVHISYSKKDIITIGRVLLNHLINKFTFSQKNRLKY